LVVTVFLALRFPIFISPCGFGGWRRSASIVRSVFSSTWGLVMIKPDTLEDVWPKLEARIASVAEVHAFGHATLIYNWLEEVAGRIFVYYLPTDTEFSESLFHKMGNPDRMLLLARLIEQQERDSGAIDALNHFRVCYDICTENRNILMHSSVESRTSLDLLPLSKRSKNMQVGKVFFQLSLTDIRAAADAMGDIFDYGTRLKLWLTYRHDHDPDLWPAPTPLPEKPRKPRKLSSSQPPADHTTSSPQPVPSLG
jgi:hypothetical protein